MTTEQIRQKVVEKMRSWIGCKESDGSHKKIIDLYNSHQASRARLCRQIHRRMVRHNSVGCIYRLRID